MRLDADAYRHAIPGLCDLFLRSFKRAIEPRVLEWRFLLHPSGDLLACVELSESRPIANYSASPCLISMGKRSLKTALSMTTMTDPDHASKGHFTRLASEIYEEMQSESYSFIWGFPNRQSHPGFVGKLGWRNIYEVPTMRLDLRGARESSAPHPVNDDNFNLTYRPGILPRDLLHVAKDAEFLRWRYRDHPTQKYRNFVITGANGIVLSHCVFKQYGESLDIVDLRASDPDHGALLLKQALSFAKDRGLAAAQCWAPRHHFVHSICEKLGFQNDAPITYFGARLFSSDSALGSRLYDYSSWYLQMGDSDVY